MDRIAPEDRSRLMSRVRSVDTKPEMVVRRRLHAAGLRFRLHRKDLPGRPDLVLPRLRIAVFVHGCFWHGHEECDRGRRRPKTRTEFWDRKLQENRGRDARVAAELQALGWRVVTVWECETKRTTNLERALEPILRAGGKDGCQEGC